jgi:hypothetical protein
MPHHKPRRRPLLPVAENGPRSDIVANIAFFLPVGIVLAVFGPVREDGVVQS